MTAITIRELRNNGGEVIERVLRGESLVVTRDGAEVAELRPRRRRPLAAGELTARWSSLPQANADRMRDDIDALIDPTL